MSLATKRLIWTVCVIGAVLALAGGVACVFGAALSNGPGNQTQQSNFGGCAGAFAVLWLVLSGASALVYHDSFWESEDQASQREVNESCNRTHLHDRY